LEEITSSQRKPEEKRGINECKRRDEAGKTCKMRMLSVGQCVSSNTFINPKGRGTKPLISKDAVALSEI
jgi:hypothetical protein